MKKNKKKKIKYITGWKAIVLLIVLVLLYLSPLMHDPTYDIVPWYLRLLIFILAAIAIFLLEMLVDNAIILKKYERVLGGLTIFAENFFTFVLFPGMILSIIYLGAYSAKYPPASYPNGTFQENVNKSLTGMGDVTSNAFARMSNNLYDIGRNRPNFFYYLLPVAIVVLTWLSIPSKKDIDEKIKKNSVKNKE